MSNITERKCGECGVPLVGRADKRFCSDQCRNTYNNKINSDTTNLMRTVNHVLRKNRRILSELRKHGESRITRDKLLAQGFNFNHFTSSKTTKAGDQFFYCYEQGYIRLKKGYYKLISKSETLP